MRLIALLAPVIDFLFPPRCPLCGTALLQHGGLCAECWNGLMIPADPACARCSRPFSAEVQPGTVCAPCLATPPRHAGIAAATIYNDTARDLVLAFKRGGRIALAPLLARLMWTRLPIGGPVPIGASWLVIPVPLHRWRLWARGFNQSALLAGELARLTGAELLVDAHVRVRATPSLGGLGRQARARALRGVIRAGVATRTRIRGRPVILVDDVLTSGATSEACTRALLRAGAASVLIACFSRVLDVPPQGSREGPGTGATRIGPDDHGAE